MSSGRILNSLVCLADEDMKSKRSKVFAQDHTGALEKPLVRTESPQLRCCPQRVRGGESPMDLHPQRPCVRQGSIFKSFLRLLLKKDL